MGYQHRLWKSTCGGCKTKYIFNRGHRPKAAPRGQWTCPECNGVNKTGLLSDWPEVPRTLFLGHDHNRLLKAYPFSPESAHEQWAEPFSVRSFVDQASGRLGGCRYSCNKRGDVYGETVYSDVCADPRDEWGDDNGHECHVLAGWSAGEASCPLGDKILELCQTDPEQKFIRHYLRYVKDRQFPMLLPQARIGITERRRPDFVAFVPLQHWRYKWVAVELDGGHPEEKYADDVQRNSYYIENNYEPISLRPKDAGYLAEVRNLVERFDVWMNMAITDEWEVAVELPVASHTPHKDDEIPF